jgi:curved DNA-binding protein
LNYYLVLGVSPNATSHEIKQAYAKLARQFHPDRNKSLDATNKMAEINIAYETLCDAEKRKEYNFDNDIKIWTTDGPNHFDNIQNMREYYSDHESEHGDVGVIDGHRSGTHLMT